MNEQERAQSVPASNDGLQRQPRVDLEVGVDLEFESFQGFLSEYSSNISTGGMFVKTDSPPPVGTELKFSFRLKGDHPLIQGTGQVAWVRQHSGGPGEPAGIGIRFLSLPDSTEDLIRKMVDRHREQGGRPFDLKSPPPGPSFAQDKAPEEASAGGKKEAGISFMEPSKPLLPSSSSAIFVPPDPQAGGRTVAPRGPGPASPATPAAAPYRPPEGGVVARRDPRRLRLAVVIPLVLISAAVGALAHAFGGQIVALATGYDQELEQPQVFDVPPPETLVSERRQVPPPAPVEGAAAEDAAGAAGSSAEGGPDSRTNGVGVGPAVDPETVAAAAPQALLNRVRLITWKEEGQDGTLVTLWGDGHLMESSLDSLRLGDRSPRQVIKLQGVNWPFRDPVMDVETDEVRRIRTGFHPKAAGNELHIVLDLTDAAVELTRLDRGPRNVELLFQRQ